MIMVKKTILIFIKLTAVIALVGIIFYNIDWVDEYSHITKKGVLLEQKTGAISGPWDSEFILFYEDGSPNKIKKIKRGLQSDGTRLVITPGFLTYIKNLNLTLFLYGALMFFFFVLVINSRWWFLLRANNLNVSFLEAQKFGWIGMFFSNILPGATGGDIAKAIYIARTCPNEKVKAIVSILIDRIIGVVSLLFVGSLASFLIFNRFPIFAITIWTAGLATVLFCLLLINSRLRTILKIDRFINKMPNKIRSTLIDLDKAVLHYSQHTRSIGVWILASPLIYTLFIGSIFFMDRALGVGLPLTDYFFIVPIAAVVQGIPIAPAGWGIGEAAYGTLIGKLGAETLITTPDAEQIMRTRGVALSVIHRVHVAMWSLLGGVLVLIYRKKR